MDVFSKYLKEQIMDIIDSDKKVKHAKLAEGIEAAITGKSLSDAFILTSTNPQFEKRLFIELPVQYMKTTSSEHGENMLCTQIAFCFCFDIQNNLCTQHVLPMF